MCACLYREAQEEGQYAEAFWLCAQCIKSMEELGDGLKVVQHVSGVHCWGGQSGEGVYTRGAVIMMNHVVA